MTDALIVIGAFGGYLYLIVCVARVVGFSERDDRE